MSLIIIPWRALLPLGPRVATLFLRLLVPVCLNTVTTSLTLLLRDRTKPTADVDLDTDFSLVHQSELVIHLALISQQRNDQRP